MRPTLNCDLFFSRCVRHKWYEIRQADGFCPDRVSGVEREKKSASRLVDAAAMPSPTAVPHMGNVLPAVSHTPRGLGVRCGGGSFLSLGRPGRDGRREGDGCGGWWGGREPARHHARAPASGAEESFLRPPLPPTRLAKASLSRWLSEVAGRSGERGFERSARARPLPSIIARYVHICCVREASMKWRIEVKQEPK